MDKIITVLYLLIWFSLLVHCFMKQRFFPLLSTGWSTKILWLFTFIFFNPVLSVIYIIFGVLLPAPSSDRKSPLVRITSIFGLFLVIAVCLLMEAPAIGDNTNDPVTVNKDGKKNTLEFEVHAGTLKSSNSFSNSTFSSHSSNARFACRNVIIMCRSDHPMMDKAARIIQQELAKRPGIETIIYYPAGHTDPIDQMLPDIYITLDMPQFKESVSPIGRKIEAEITSYAGTSLNPGHSHSFNSNTPPILNFGFNGTLDHKSQFSGLVNEQAKYTQQAQDIAKQITKTLTEHFDKYKDKHGLMPELPGYLYGTGSEGPKFPFQQAETARKIMSGTGLLLNNHTVWMFDDNRSTLEVLKDCRDQLTAEGFKGGLELDKESKYPIEHITMSKGDIHIAIFRQRKNEQREDIYLGKRVEVPQKQKTEPMIVHYRSLFTRQQQIEAMNRLMDSDADIDTLMIFERFLRSSDLEQKLITKIENSDIKSMATYLAVANIYKSNNDLEKAKDALMMARVMAYAEKEHNPNQSEVNSLAKSLKDESLAKQEIPMEYFIKAGFINITNVTEPVGMEVKASQPATFCFLNTNGEITTLTLRLDPEPSLLEKDTGKKYGLTKILKTEDTSSVGTRSPFIGSSSEHIQDYGIVKFNVEKLEDETFRISAHPTEKYSDKTN